MTPIQSFTAALTEKQTFAEGVSLFTFYILESKLSFTPGQYIIVNIPTSQGSVKRLYSIASSNTSTDSFTLLIKDIPGGVASTHLNSLTFGQTISFSGPAGMFSYQQSPKPKVFITTGTGFAPIRSILLSLPKNDTSKKTLLWGMPTAKSVYLFNELLSFEKNLLFFSFQLCLSQEQSLLVIPAQFRHYFRLGRVTPALGLAQDTSANENEYYFCGSREIVESLRLAFLSEKIDPSSLHFEKY